MALQTVDKKESIKVLEECMELQLKKSQDYQNPKSMVKQADHYRRGVDSIYDTMWGKMLRIRSLLESGDQTNFESLEDSFKDLINYSSFAVEYLRYKMPGQSQDRDIFNKPKPTQSYAVEDKIDEQLEKVKRNYHNPDANVYVTACIPSPKFNPYG